MGPPDTALPRPDSRGKAAAKQTDSYVCLAAAFCTDEKNYFFWTYLRQSSVTATRMMMPENTNCRLVSMPSTVRE